MTTEGGEAFRDDHLFSTVYQQSYRAVAYFCLLCCQKIAMSSPASFYDLMSDYKNKRCSDVDNLSLLTKLEMDVGGYLQLSQYLPLMLRSKIIFSLRLYFMESFLFLNLSGITVFLLKRSRNIN